MTEEGKEALRKYQDPGEFQRQAGRLYWQWADSRPEDASEAIVAVEEGKSLATETAPSAAAK